MSTRSLAIAVAGIVLALGAPLHAEARMVAASDLVALTRSAAQIVRGRCADARTGTIDVAGARLPVTTYTFEVDERLKGAGGRTLSFTQLGASAPGGLDLATLAGLPRYRPGPDYVLFLLPESDAGLTSPAGAGEGAFVVAGEQVVPMHGTSARPTLRGAGGTPDAGRASRALADETASARPLTYGALRAAVLAELSR